LGVIAGRTLLKKIPLTLLHKVSGFIFLVLAVLAAYNAYLVPDRKSINWNKAKK
jgi:putative Ca2+/H+ antiporter (TMEM165/GDT1 family)